MNSITVIVALLIIVLIVSIYAISGNGGIQKGNIVPGASNSSTITAVTSSVYTTLPTTTVSPNNMSMNASMSPNPLTADWHGNVLKFHGVLLFLIFKSIEDEQGYVE